MKKSNVTVFIEVFNEEKRIESCLRSFSWADEIILFDKYSTDRTRDIASKYASKIILSPYCEASENIVENFSHETLSEWCLFPTASSLMHPKLADEIIKLTTNQNFEYDVIGMPYGMYSLGIRSNNSPFFRSYKYTLIRKSKLRLSNKLHHEISYNSNKIYKIPIIDDEAVLYHCTHRNVDSLLGHIIRYTKYEATYDSSLSRNQNLALSLKEIIKAILLVIVRRRAFVLGWNGLALSFGYIGYFVIKFLFIWEQNHENGNKVYSELRDKVNALWDGKNNE